MPSISGYGTFGLDAYVYLHIFSIMTIAFEKNQQFYRIKCNDNVQNECIYVLLLLHLTAHGKIHTAFE